MNTTTHILAALCLGGASAAVAQPATDRVKPVIPIKAQAFSLSDVRLLDGPFKHAQELDRRYLLSLDPDRLLHNFRVNAGLPSTAKPLGGWEAPDCELRGHFVGHYLSACAKMYASTRDEKLKHNAEYVVAELAKCQDKLGSGYLSAFPETFIDRVIARERVWAPWYTLHKILAGLIDMSQLAGDQQALDVARKMADWAKGRMDKLDDARMQAMLGTEHGGMNEALANLYAITGDKDYLALSRRFNHHAVMDPLARHEDHLTGLHANTQIPKIIGAAREYELTGDDTMQTIARFFWDTVTKERSYVIGGDSDGEMFSPKEHLSHYLGANTTETCNTYNMLKLTRHLFEWDPTSEYADYYERALYNHILASQNPEDGMMCYYVPLRSGSHKVFSTPNDSFWCCTGTGVENHSQYGGSIYFHDNGGLWVNLFIPSELAWKEKGLTVRQETRFPDADTTRLTFTCAQPTALSVRVRRPFWVGQGFGVQVNGKPVADEVGTDGYAVVNRTWKSGDTLAVTLPMSLRTEGFRDDPRRVALLYGPIVLCGPVSPGQPLPAIVTDNGRVLNEVKPVAGKALCFEASGAAFHAPGQQEGQPIELTPFYSTADHSYAVYWDEMTPAEWKAREDAHAAEVARQKELQSRTVDVVQPGNRRSERMHGFQGETTYAGDFGERNWRDARNGGWFSYVLKVAPDAQQELLCTYWGGDGGREFDVLMDGVKVGTQQLNNAHPGKFFDVAYPIPPELLAGKQTVTVRFQGAPGRSAGGVFECRVLRTAPAPAPPVARLPQQRAGSRNGVGAGVAHRSRKA